MADQEWLERFQLNDVSAPPGSFLDVEMTVSEITFDKRGRPVQDPEYAIVKVHDVKSPPETGPGLFDDGEEINPRKALKGSGSASKD
jgi:hypothetical protein